MIFFKRSKNQKTLQETIKLGDRQAIFLKSIEFATGEAFADDVKGVFSNKEGV
jgi:hypothetical protein